MKKSRQMSESIELCVVMALAGGCMDAYSYMCRGEVFANAQTGNILLLGIYISRLEWSMALRYFMPVFAFALGICIASWVRIHFKESSRIHWRQLAVLVEALVLTGVCFLPQEFNALANGLTSLACGIQVESFRKVHGSGVATTMCIGNLRNATQNICEFSHTKDREKLLLGILYYGMILCFVVGAVLGNVAVTYFAERAILLSVVLLIVGMCMMFVDRERDKREGQEAEI